MLYKSEVYGKGGIYAKVVTASISEEGIPLYTIETCAPKFIDAEFEKHRMLSSNSSSSRAIPFEKMLDSTSYFPFDVRKNQKGMQGNESIDEERFKQFQMFLEVLHKDVGIKLQAWSSIVHKQHLNRYLEAFFFQKKVVTATEWDNFFRLRLAADAQPEIQELARCMKDAIDKSELTQLQNGEWHLPYVDSKDNIKETIFVSAARCARVSYMNHDNTEPDLNKDLTLAKFLLKSKHLTPFEHQATPIDEPYNDALKSWWEDGVSHVTKDGFFWSGNFRGWIQNRKLIEEH